MPADKKKKTFDDVPSALIRRFPRGPVDWSAVIAELEAKRDALDKAIASFRLVMASGVLFGAVEDAMPPMADNVAVGLHGGEVPVGAFLGKSIPEAAKLCLQITKRKMKTREIADALVKGGIETTAKTSFPAIVHSILMRTVRSGGGIVKLDRSYWGLEEWYPASMRATSSTKRGGTKLRHRVGRKAKRSATITAEEKPKEQTVRKDSVPQKIWEAIKDKELSSGEVANAVGIKANVAAMLLARMISPKWKWAEKTASGKYRAIKAA